METGKRIIKNTAFLTGGKILGDFLVFFFLAYFGRIFGLEILGKYAFAMSIGGILTVVYSLGFNTLTTREVSRDRSQNAKYLGNLLITRGVLSLIVWGLVGIVLWFTPLSFDTKIIILLITGYHVFYKLTGLLRCAFIAHQEMQYPAFLEFFHRLIILSLGGACIFFLKNPVMTLAVYPLSTLMMFLVGFFVFHKKYGLPDFDFDSSFVKKCIIESIPFLFIMVLTQFYDRIGIVILTLLKGEAASGTFAAGDRLFVVVTTTMTMFSASLFPVMSQYSVQAKEKLIKLSIQTSRILIVLLLPLSLLIYILSPEVIAITFGEKFSDSAAVLQTLTWALIFIGLNSILSNFLIVKDRQNVLLKIRTVIYGLHLLTSFALIWRFDYQGLACARLLSEVLLFIATLFCIQRSFEKIPVLRMMLVPSFACCVGILIYQQMEAWPLWFVLPCVVAVYLVLLFFPRGIEINDLLYLKQIFSTRTDTSD